MTNANNSPEIRQAVNRLVDNVKDKQAQINNEIIDFINQKNQELINFIMDHDDSFFIDEHVCITCGQKTESDL